MSGYIEADNIYIEEIASYVSEIMSYNEENNPQQCSIEIYPNPFSETATITLEGIQLPTTLTIYNNIGQAIQQETITQNTHTIHRNNLSGGIYFYHVNGQSGKLVITE